MPHENEQFKIFKDLDRELQRRIVDEIKRIHLLTNNRNFLIASMLNIAGNAIGAAIGIMENENIRYQCIEETIQRVLNSKINNYEFIVRIKDSA